jgi:hypothetical protein
MIRIIATLGYVLVVIGVIGIVLGTTVLLVQQLLLLGILLLVGAGIWKFWSSPE